MADDPNPGVARSWRLRRPATSQGRFLPALLDLRVLAAPSITMSFRWDSSVNSAGFPGHACSTSLGPGQGQHGSMSPHETRNVLFARGPAFKQSAVVSTPTGNVDLAPSILHLLELPGAESMHGRILTETLRNGPDSVDSQTQTRDAECEVHGGRYSQNIAISRVEDTVYIDQGFWRNEFRLTLRLPDNDND